MAEVWANSMACHPRATYHIATWWIHCRDSKATCRIAGCKNSIRHIEKRFSPYFYFFLFLMQFRIWRAASFVSSSIHSRGILNDRQRQRNLEFGNAWYVINNKKLSCRREAARRYGSLKILLSVKVTQGHAKLHCWVGSGGVSSRQRDS